ncbi:DUF4038 domain-containing protein [Paenibacillus sp. T1]|uniref:DUF4038 domain-containing protein n=2 Tax=Paenibacillus glycinis TaxID=2697035 RepID=A0ABW9XTH8_9BACL|nr:DUF4038 domain-containing protein [Paenibacillus glycinis]
MQPLRISDNGRHLIQADGTPFFWLADTAWQLFRKLDRAEADLYLRSRAEQGFTVILAVVLAELDGAGAGNAYNRHPLRKNGDGEYDPLQPDLAAEGDYGYWEHVDYIVDKAAEYGLYIGLLPAWGDKINQAWGKGPEIFRPDNAAAFGDWIGRRYGASANIVWVLGGDRELTNRRHFSVIQAMAEAIRKAARGKQLMTFHPNGKQSSSLYMHEEDWLDFNMIQSSHYELNYPNEALITKDYGLSPAKPVVDAEPCYEDHPIGFRIENGFFDAKDVRQAAYFAVFAGAFGHTYGHHCVWSMTKETTDTFIMLWSETLSRPGANQMAHLKRLAASRPTLDRVPDQSLLVSNYPGACRLQACRGKDYAFIYSPNGLPVVCRLGSLPGSELAVRWFDPRTGESFAACTVTNSGEERFAPPSSGRTDDWVLMLDDASNGYPAP